MGKKSARGQQIFNPQHRSFFNPKKTNTQVNGQTDLTQNDKILARDVVTRNLR